jgi:hypothetical protein
MSVKSTGLQTETTFQLHVVNSTESATVDSKFYAILSKTIWKFRPKGKNRSCIVADMQPRFTFYLHRYIWAIAHGIRYDDLGYIRILHRDNNVFNCTLSNLCSTGDRKERIQNLVLLNQFLNQNGLLLNDFLNSVPLSLELLPNHDSKMEIVYVKNINCPFLV